MSKIQGKPFIDNVISSVEDKSELLALLNGKTKVPTFYSLINETYPIDDTNEVQFVTLETQNKSYTGYLIVNDDYCVVIAFTDDVQTLDVLNIVDNNYELINESLTINELRTVLGLELVEAGELVHVQADDVDSGTATNGQVLTADGDGGASWITPDKPIHFIKLTSTTLTEALRTEILSDDYFVIIKYNNRYYYEVSRSSPSYTEKTFKTQTTITNNDADNRIQLFRYAIYVISNDLNITTYSEDVSCVRNKARPKNIAGITDAGVNATAGQVLMADGSGGTSWGSASSTTFVDWS